jgi:DNA modification methylase
VLDPFCGSGTTLKVARELHRDAIGIELSAEFAELARERAGFCEDITEAA